MGYLFLILIGIIVTLLYKLEQSKARARTLLNVFNTNLGMYLISARLNTLEKTLDEMRPYYNEYMDHAFTKYLKENKIDTSETRYSYGVDYVDDLILLDYLTEEELVICLPFFTVVTEMKSDYYPK